MERYGSAVHGKLELGVPGTVETRMQPNKSYHGMPNVIGTYLKKVEFSIV
ncbi:hypothetical protein [Cecembia rubra]|nr:hypothetical protein [Cecembia rubra]